VVVYAINYQVSGFTINQVLANMHINRCYDLDQMSFAIDQLKVLVDGNRSVNNRLVQLCRFDLGASCDCGQFSIAFARLRNK
jgi:hypothetical protein